MVWVWLPYLNLGETATSDSIWVGRLPRPQSVLGGYLQVGLNPRQSSESTNGVLTGWRCSGAIAGLAFGSAVAGG